MNIFKQLIKSIYSPKDIALFRFQGIGKTILFVFLLTFISVLPSTIYLSTALSTGIDSARTVISDKLPDFSIKNGQLSADTKVPVISNQDDFTIILDPTGVMTDAKVENEGNAFALLKDEFVLAAGGNSSTYPYAMFQGLNISKEDLLKTIETIGNNRGIIIPLLCVAIYLFSSAASFIEVSILAFIGLALKNLLGKRLTYRQIWRMTAYSETLPTLFFTIMTAIKTTVPNSFMINLLVVLIVLFLAINEIPRPKQKIS